MALYMTNADKDGIQNKLYKHLGARMDGSGMRV